MKMWQAQLGGQVALLACVGTQSVVQVTGAPGMGMGGLPWVSSMMHRPPAPAQSSSSSQYLRQRPPTQTWSGAQVVVMVQVWVSSPTTVVLRARHLVAPVVSIWKSRSHTGVLGVASQPHWSRMLHGVPGAGRRIDRVDRRGVDGRVEIVAAGVVGAAVVAVVLLRAGAGGEHEQDGEHGALHGPIVLRRARLRGGRVQQGPGPGPAVWPAARG